jgi:hypothetical protein
MEKGFSGRVSLATTRWAPSRINHIYLTNLSHDSLPPHLYFSIRFLTFPLLLDPEQPAGARAQPTVRMDGELPSKVMRGCMHGRVIAPAIACGCGEEIAAASQHNGERMW